MDWLFVVTVFIVFFINQLLANWLYHRRVKKSMTKFFAQAKIRYPEAEITIAVLEASDLDAINELREKLDEHYRAISEERR